MLKIVITGGIASGKSFTLKVISKLRIPVISADEEIAKIYNEKEILLKIGRELDIANPSKKVIKPIVLKDINKLRKLEKILYKELYKKFDNFAETCRRKNYKICAFEVPLVFEKHTEKRYDKVLNIETPIFIQKRRFLKRNGALEKDFYKFLNLQFHFIKKQVLTKNKGGIIIKNIYKNTVKQCLLKGLK